MSELDDAIARLQRAVARLEAASGRRDAVIEAQIASAAGVAAHIDAALERLGRLLEPEG